MAPLRVAPACAGARLQPQPAPRGLQAAGRRRRCCPPAPRAAAAPGPGGDAGEAIGLARDVLDWYHEKYYVRQNIKSDLVFWVFLAMLPNLIQEEMECRRAEAAGAQLPAAGAPSPVARAKWSDMADVWRVVQPLVAKRAAAAVGDARAAAAQAAAAAAALFAKYWPLPLPAKQQAACMQLKQDRPAEPAAGAAPAAGSSSSGGAPSPAAALELLVAAEGEASLQLQQALRAAAHLAAAEKAALQAEKAALAVQVAALQAQVAALQGAQQGKGAGRSNKSKRSGRR